MCTNKEIICLGDGFAHGHIWPEWPQILQALVPEYNVTVISGVGAGQEFLINGLLKCPLDRQIVIFQWPYPLRFDKMIQDRAWTDIGKQDEIYHFNFYQRDKDTWWLSSESKHEKIQEYHNFYIQPQQAEQRQLDQKILVKGHLQNQKCLYIETSTVEQESFSRRTEFLNIRGDQVQPSPLVHYQWLIEEILPRLPMSVDTDRKARLGTLIQDQEWQPFDPDRNSIWKEMLESLDKGFVDSI